MTARFAASVTALLFLAAPATASALGPTPGPTPAGSATGSAAPAAVLPVAVTLGDLTPIAPQPGDMLRITGTLRNQSAAPVGNLAVQLRYNPHHIGSRSEFEAYAVNADGTPAGPLPLPATVASAAIATPLATHTLAPGRSEPFTLTIPVDALSLPSPWQVYELAVAVTGTTPAGSVTVGGLRTFLPWAPANLTKAEAGYRTQVAWIWPLVDRPHRTVGATFTDDSLAADLAPTGRLGRLVTAAAGAEVQHAPPPPKPARKTKKKARPVVTRVVTGVPVTWAIDPMLVEDAQAMATGYRVGPGRKPGAGAAAAKSWLAALRTATASSQVLGLPYADPDVVAADRVTRLAGEVQVATNKSQSMLSDALSTSPLSYAWPPNGQLDQATLDTLFAAGISTIVLDSNALPTVTEPNETPSAHTTIRARDGNLDALLVDHDLNQGITDGLRSRTQQRLALQRFLAETLMIQAERPFDQRTVVLAPDRRWAPQASYAAALVADTGKVPWIAPVPLSAALATAQSDVTRASLVYPPAAHRQELTRDYLSGVVALKTSADLFAAILPTAGDPQARAFDDGVLRTLSSAWRGHGDDAVRARDAINEALVVTKRRVHIASAPGSFVTLTSHSGTVPITVANDLDTPVSVVVQINSPHLQLSRATTEPIPPHRQIAVDVRATARTSGVFPLDVRLLTPTSPRRVYDTTQLFVRSTAYGAVTLVITGGATGVLLLAVIVRLIRRALAARRTAAGTG